MKIGRMRKVTNRIGPSVDLKVKPGLTFQKSDEGDGDGDSSGTDRTTGVER